MVEIYADFDGPNYGSIAALDEGDKLAALSTYFNKRNPDQLSALDIALFEEYASLLKKCDSQSSQWKTNSDSPSPGAACPSK